MFSTVVQNDNWYLNIIIEIQSLVMRNKFLECLVYVCAKNWSFVTNFKIENLIYSGKNTNSKTLKLLIRCEIHILFSIHPNLTLLFRVNDLKLIEKD